MNACEGPLHDGRMPPRQAEGWLEHRELVPRDGRLHLPVCRPCFEFATLYEPGLWAFHPFVVV